MVPTGRDAVLFGDANALLQLPHLLLGDRCQNIGHQVGDLAAFTYAMRRYAKDLQLLAATHALQYAAPETVQAYDDHHHRLACRAALSHIGQQRLILWAIVALAREHVLVLVAEQPAMLRSVSPAFGKLCVKAHALARLLLRTHARVDQCDGERRRSDCGAPLYHLPASRVVDLS